ncbi:MAG: DASH family cryptochrome [Fulvivirga sp.]
MSKVIVWLKNDLRLADNELFYQATKNNKDILPVFIFDPRQFKKLPELGFSKTGALKTKFLIESVAYIRAELKKMGANLIVRVGHPEKILPEVATNINAEAIYLTKEVTFEEQQVVNQLELELSKTGVALNQHWQGALYHEEDVPWPIRQVPQVFTTFRKETQKESPVREVFNRPSSINYIAGIAEGEIPTVTDLGLDEEKIDGKAVIQFQGGEGAAWDRLNEYFWEKDLLKEYKATRNGLLGADYSSKLSPWLAVGAISAKLIYHEIKKYEAERTSNQSTYWLYFELVWRDFFTYMAKQNNSNIFKYEGFNGTPPEVNNGLDTFEKWKNGETGEPFVDANMKELLLTGYMSNRGRQNAASYLMYNLKVNWTWGAAWYENRLIDYDPCSNWLNWAYIAGVGNDPRQGRHFNIESQQQRYDPKGEYIDYWLG